MKAHLVVHQGEDFLALGGSKFKKDVVRVGKWIHPVTGREIVFDAARLQRLAANTEKYRKNVDKEVIPFPDGHSFKAVDGIGDVEKFYVEGDRLYGTFVPAGKDIEQKLDSKKIRSVSAYIDFNVKDSHGNVYDEAITHVAATPYPVVTGQEDFIKLSSKDDAFDLFIAEELSNGGSDVLKTHDHLRRELQARMDEHKKCHKDCGPDHEDTKKAASRVQDAAHRLRRQAEVIHSHTMNATGGPTYMSSTTEGLSPEGIEERTDMDPKKMALALGLPETATPAQIEEAAKNATAAQKQALDQLKAEQAKTEQLSASLKAHGLEYKDGKVVKLSADPSDETPREKALRLENAQLKATQALGSAKEMAKRVDDLIKSGIIEPKKREILSRLVSVPAQIEALVLSKDASGLESVRVNVSNDVFSLLEGMPSQFAQQLSQSGGGSAHGGEDEKKAAAEAEKEAEASLKRVMPQKEAAAK